MSTFFIKFLYLYIYQVFNWNKIYFTHPSLFKFLNDFITIFPQITLKLNILNLIGY